MRHQRRPVHSIVNSWKHRDYVTKCEDCDKDLFRSKKDAKRRIRDTPEPGLCAYECEILEGWHIGHLPWMVRKGRLTRAEYYKEGKR